MEKIRREERSRQGAAAWRRTGLTVVLCVVLAGKKLKDMDTIGRQDPFCIVVLMDGRKTVQQEKTKVLSSAGVNPKWKDEVRARAPCTPGPPN